MPAHSQATRESFYALPSADWDHVDQVLERFEDACAGGCPVLEDFLEGAGVQRQALLVELVHADLHYRVKRGVAVGVEAYFAALPGVRRGHTGGPGPD